MSDTPARADVPHRSDRIAPAHRHWRDLETSLLARSLTAPADPAAVSHATTRAPVDVQARVRRARHILERLESHADRLRNQLAGDGRRLSRLIRALVDDDQQELAAHGLDVGYAWLDDLLTALVTGAPFVEVETVGPYASHHLTPDGELDVSHHRLPSGERAGILLGALLRDAFDGCPNVRIVSLLDDFNDGLGGDLVEPMRDSYVVRIGEVLFEQRMLRPDDVPGSDYVLLRESTGRTRVADLVERLRACGRGSVEETPDGDVVFWPSNGLVDQLALRSTSRTRELARRGVLLARSGRPTCQAIDAAGYLQPENERILHVVMLDRGFASQQDKTYTLLRALDIARQDSYHNVFYDADALTPEVIVFAICQLMIGDLQRLIAMLGRFDEWERFDADEYRERNYGLRVLAEDREIIHFVAQQLAASDISAGSVRRAIDVGAGPNLYPAMLIAPYLADEGTITLSEYAEANLVSLKDSLRAMAEDSRESTWTPFHQLMVEADERYRDVLVRLPRLCQVQQGSIYGLPIDTYDLLTSFFVAESITTSRREFRRAIQAMKQAVRVGGTLAVAFMVASTGYPAGQGTRFPAVRLSIADIEEACRDADLDFVMHAANGAEKARPGYQGMAAVVARRVR